jgi:hypothetical protein
VDGVELIGRGQESRRRRERDAEHGKERECKTEEDGDAADAWFGEFVQSSTIPRRVARRTISGVANAQTAPAITKAEA